MMRMAGPELDGTEKLGRAFLSEFIWLPQFMTVCNAPAIEKSEEDYKPARGATFAALPVDYVLFARTGCSDDPAPKIEGRGTSRFCH